MRQDRRQNVRFPIDVIAKTVVDDIIRPSTIIEIGDGGCLIIGDFDIAVGDPIFILFDEDWTGGFQGRVAWKTAYEGLNKMGIQFWSMPRKQQILMVERVKQISSHHIHTL